MNGETKNGMGCSEFDLLLTDAIDGQLTGEQLARFEQHKSSCTSCAAMFSEVRAGLNWLNQVEEIEPPRHLMHNILVATSGVAERATATVETGAKGSLGERMKTLVWPVFAPIFTTRFAMSAAMAFFAVTLSLNVADIHLSQVDLSAKGITRTYYATEARAVKYYENIRLVYEIESRVKEYRRAAEGSDQKTNETEPKQQQENNKSNKDSEPERQEQNYSQRTDELIEASQQVQGIGIIARQRRLS
jgi:hypothetical protein